MTPTAETGANLDTATIVSPDRTRLLKSNAAAEEAPAAEEATTEVSAAENADREVRSHSRRSGGKATKALK